MIYADDVCLPLGRYGNTQIVGPLPAQQLDGFRAHWRYNRADASCQRLLATTPYYAVWDDHEIRNDSGPHDDQAWLAPGGHLLPAALQAFLDYQPLIPPASAPTHLYRSVRWGKYVELFVLDTRQYRDPIAALDSEAQPKTMLGAEQMAWLEQALAASDATWKVIVASVPLSIPTGTVTGDGFADGGTGTGYEREAARIFRALRAGDIRNSLWITTDIHFATGFIYRPFPDDPGWTAYEFTSGPLNAGIFPNQKLDPTFHPERLFLYAPPSPDIASFDDALGWFNFGLVEVDTAGALTVSIVNGRGETVVQHRLDPISG
jgi:alkaline phosphatase D